MLILIILGVFGFLSLLATILFVAACMRSSQISQNGGDGHEKPIFQAGCSADCWEIL